MTVTVWEYKVVKEEAEGIVFPNVDGISETFLNGMGRDGWELVQVVNLARWTGRTTVVYFYFKRQMPAEVVRKLEEGIKKRKTISKPNPFRNLPPVPKSY